MQEDVAARYARAVVCELESFAARGEELPRVDTVYFGGGTPSIVPTGQIRVMLDACRSIFTFSADCEITLEANPGTVTPARAAEYRKMGVNRISMGAQSFSDAELESIGRTHTSAETATSATLLRAAGVTNINLDLMAGLPGQTGEQWSANLERMVEIRPAHVSMYMLDLDEHSPLFHSVQSGLCRLPDDDRVADFYMTTLDRLAQAGYVQYEISNFALPGLESRHNLKYWERDPVFGFGVSSHSYDGHSRYANHANLNAYLEAVEARGSAVEWRRQDDPSQSPQEALFLGLRLCRGLDWDRLRAVFGDTAVGAYEPVISEMAAAELVVQENGIVRLTARGMLLSNEIFQRFV